MLATYSGVVTAELSCVELYANLRIKTEKSMLYDNITDIELVPTGDGYTYTWTQSIIGYNIYYSPVGKIHVKDFSNGADADHIVTEPKLWAPPCYLEVNRFEKLDQIESND